MNAKEMFEAEWTEDCQDKWDYDFPVISVSTRYWGRDIFALPSIFLGNKVIVQHKGYIEAETEAQCKAKVEKWVDEQLEILLNALKSVGWIE